jgi:hypothetical protein
MGGSRMPKKLSLYIIMLISLIRSLAIFVGNSREPSKTVKVMGPDLSVKADLPIIITSDSDFLGYPGFGNESHPYKIYINTCQNISQDLNAFS